MKKIFTPIKSVALFALFAAGTATMSAQYAGVGTFNKINSIDEITSGSYMLVANKKAMSNEFRELLQKECVNPYGDGHASERIVDAVIERFSYLLK